MVYKCRMRGCGKLLKNRQELEFHMNEKHGALAVVKELDMAKQVQQQAPLPMMDLALNEQVRYCHGMMKSGWMT